MIKAIKYTVEVRQGGNSTMEFPWWGPLEWAQVVHELKEEGYVPISISWPEKYDNIVKEP